MINHADNENAHSKQRLHSLLETIHKSALLGRDKFLADRSAA